MTVFESNHKLLEGFREGKAESLTVVYRRFVGDVASLVSMGFFLESKGGTRVPGIPRPEIERELVQEVFVRAFSEKARRAFDGLRPYRPYLMQIARNLMIDHWRKQGRELPFAADCEDPDVLIEQSAASRAEAPEPEEDLDWRKRIEATRNYLQGLGPELREFVRLRFEEERSQYELMDILKLSRWRIRSMENKVQVGLTKYLKRLGLYA